VTNIDDIWEMDLAELSSLSKYNDKYKYLLNVIDIFSRYAWSVPLKDKSATSITSASKTLFQNRKPINIQSDKRTEFVNGNVPQYLKRLGVRFHTTLNPDIKGAIVERFRSSLKSRMYMFFTKNNTYCYLDFVNKLVIGYNSSVHSTIGMAPGKVTPSNIYTVWRKINSLRAKISQSHVKFNVGDLVRITKVKVSFAKGYEQTLSTEIFRTVKNIHRVPQSVYELSDLQERLIEFSFTITSLSKLLYRKNPS